MSKRPAPLPNLDDSDDDYRPSTSKRAKVTKAKPAADATTILSLSTADLNSLTKPELVSHVQVLQKLYSKAGTSAAPSGPPQLSPQDLATKVEQARTLMVRGIKSQMKWKVHLS